MLLPMGWIRGAKVIAAMASGAWLLSDSYLTACSKAHQMLEEVRPAIRTVPIAWAAGRRNVHGADKVLSHTPAPRIDSLAWEKQG